MMLFKISHKKYILENNKLRRTFLIKFSKINYLIEKALNERLILLFKRLNN